MKSFRVRIIVWTTVIAGTVMLGFGIAGNIAFQQIKAKQVEDSLVLFSDRFTPPPAHDRFWDRFGAEGAAELEDRLGAEVVFAVYGKEVGAAEGRDYQLVSWGKFRELFVDNEELPPVDGVYDPLDDRNRGPVGRLSRGFGAGPERDRSRRLSEEQPRPTILSRVSSVDGSHWRLSLTKFKGYNFLIGVNIENVREDSALMRRAFAIAFPLALGAMALSIWIFVTKAIKPVRRLSGAIESVSAKSLGARLESDGEYEEFSSLIIHFNGMLDRLERSFTQATRFSADAAHELKTPLAILQGQLEVALQEAPDDSDQQRQLASLLEEAHRLKSITRKLLILAKADAGTLEAQIESVDIKELLNELVSMTREDTPGLSIELEADGFESKARCDETLTRQILNNLIGNACKYRSPLDSTVTVSLSSTHDFARIEIANCCQAIDPETRSRLFDRFIRGNAARDRSDDGTGLGLSLSLEFARAQQSQLSLLEADDECRVCMRLDLPLS